MLSAGQLDLLTDYTLQMNAAEDYSELARIAIEAASRLVSCDSAVLTFAPAHFPLVRHNATFGGMDWDRYYRDLAAVSDQDAGYTARLRLLPDRPGSPVELASPRRLARSRVQQEVWRPLGAVRQLRVLNPGPFSQAVILTRSAPRDFSPGEAALMHALSRHIPAALQQLIRRNGGRLPVQGGRIGVERFCWLVVDLDGRVLRAQPEALECMRLCLGPHARLDRIPAEWLGELQRRASGHPATVLRHSAGRRTFSVHVAPIRGAPGEGSVAFVEYPMVSDSLAALRALSLTQREAEVMREVISGRTNAEIGVQLGISAATAKKHVENVLAKLGAPNRAAAVAQALAAMQAAGAVPLTPPVDSPRVRSGCVRV